MILTMFAAKNNPVLNQALGYSFPSLKSRIDKVLYSKGYFESLTVYSVEVHILNWSIYSKCISISSVHTL